ncbi:MAG: hypothetical protein M3N52_00575 [Actinomycetota bacterium]|nr:hypothetical protein [Actinomycetota bacterium]
MSAALRIRRHVVVLLAACAALLLLPASRPAGAHLVGDAVAPLLGDSGADWVLGGQPCRLIEVPAAAPVGIGSCSGVRPGAPLLVGDGLCTFNYLFTGSDGARYMGTAGHCFFAPFDVEPGEMSWALGAGPPAFDAAGNRVGGFAYAVQRDEKDFGLIRLDDAVAANPQMCFFGGPTGINDDRPGLLEPVLLNYYGNGILVSGVLPARTAVATGMPDPDHVFADGVAIFGDSGAAVNSADGRAVGSLVTVGVALAGLGLDGLDAGVIGITRLTPQLERAEQVLGVDLVLQTAPTL